MNHFAIFFKVIIIRYFKIQFQIRKENRFLRQKKIYNCSIDTSCHHGQWSYNVIKYNYLYLLILYNSIGASEEAFGDFNEASSKKYFLHNPEDHHASVQHISLLQWIIQKKEYLVFISLIICLYIGTKSCLYLTYLLKNKTMLFLSTIIDLSFCKT